MGIALAERSIRQTLGGESVITGGDNGVMVFWGG